MDDVTYAPKPQRSATGLVVCLIGLSLGAGLFDRGQRMALAAALSSYGGDGTVWTVLGSLLVLGFGIATLSFVHRLAYNADLAALYAWNKANPAPKKKPQLKLHD